MRIVYKGTRSGKTRVAIITYGDSEENVAYDIVHEIRVATSYKVDTGVYGMLIVDVDDINDYNNFKECYKEFKKTALSEHTAEHTTAEQTEAEATSEQTTAEQSEHNKKYIVRAFENEKELTVQCPYFPTWEYAIDYINNMSENGVVSRDVVFTINNSGIYDCFSDVKLTGTTAQIKYATDILNAFYMQLCNDITYEYKMRIYDDIDVESKDYYASLNTFVTILKKVLNGNRAKSVITNYDKFEPWGNIHITAINFIISYNADEAYWDVKRVENKLRKELFKDIQKIF